MEAKKSNVLYMVLARGFQWKVTKKDVMQFFKGINILNGEKGINIMKNVAMEAFVELASKADVKKALALNNKRVESRTVHGNYLFIFNNISAQTECVRKSIFFRNKKRFLKILSNLCLFLLLKFQLINLFFSL